MLRKQGKQRLGSKEEITRKEGIKGEKKEKKEDKRRKGTGITDVARTDEGKENRI